LPDSGIFGAAKGLKIKIRGKTAEFDPKYYLTSINPV